MLTLFDQIPEDIQSLMNNGVSIVAGEVENHWGRILKDAVDGKLKPLYNLLGEYPDLSSQPVPVVNKKYLRRFVFSDFGTIDCGRGCPFNCAFCTIINIHGRKVRCRDPEVIAEAIRRNYKAGISFYFFTDDNFARNRKWESIFDMLIRLRTEEKIDVDFMMQVDVLSYKIKNFIDKARKAGCTNVFIGMESVNPKNLDDAGKVQNVVDDFANLISAWHQAGVSTHVGYIIGFPGDTVESVKKDVDTLTRTIRTELASFFMLTPLPGSMDHLRLVSEGAYMDPDYNNFDSFHVTFNHTNLSRSQWEEAYNYAWETFYGFENMRDILKQSNKHKRYWDAIWKFIWYKGSYFIENCHPMVTGLFRLKNRKIRRPGYAIESLWAYSKMRVTEMVKLVIGFLKIWWEVQELWLQTRPQTSFEIRLVKEWKHLRESVAGRLTVLEWKGSRTWRPLKRALERVNVFSLKGIQSRQDLNQFWSHARAQLTHGRLHRIRPIKIVTNGFRDFRISLHFIRSVLGGISKKVQISNLPLTLKPSDKRPAVIALSLPEKYGELKRSIESFLRELGVDIVSTEGTLGNIDLWDIHSGSRTTKIVRGYIEGLKGRADFVLLPFAKGLEEYHEHFVAGLSDMANDVKERLSLLPRVIHFPIIGTESHALKDSLIRLGLCFTDDIASVIVASEKAVSHA
jgi:radical SAM superfamily enzyme YgiQ (UPF0313 family)